MASIADTFTRANSATTINPASDGGSWTVDAGTWGITSNQGYTVNATGGTVINGHLIVRRDAGGPIQDFTITNGRSSNNGASGLWINYDPATQSGYMLLFDSSNSFGSISRVDSGALGSPSTSVTFTTWTGSTAVLRMTSDGAGTIKVYQGGTLKATLTDTTGSPPPNKGTWVGFSTNASSTPFGTDKWTAFTGTGALPGRGWVVGAIGWGGASRDCLRDTFSRAANSSSPNPASDGGSWTVFAGTYGVEVISGVAHLYNSGYGLWASGGWGSNTGGPDPLGANPAMGRDLGSAVQDVTWRIHCDDATDRFVMLNFDPGTRAAYMLSTDGSTIFRLYHTPANTPGSRTLLASFTFTTFTTSTVRVTHDGAGHLEVFQDGVSLGTVTDASPLTGTWVGIAEATNGSTHAANWWDSFSACPN